MGLSTKSFGCYRRKSKLRKTSLTTGDDDRNDLSYWESDYYAEFDTNSNGWEWYGGRRRRLSAALEDSESESDAAPVSNTGRYFFHRKLKALTTIRSHPPVGTMIHHGMIDGKEEYWTWKVQLEVHHVSCRHRDAARPPVLILISAGIFLQFNLTFSFFSILQDSKC